MELKVIKKRLSIAKKLGINQIFNIKKKDIKNYLSKLTIGYGMDVVFECSGSVEAVEYGLNFTRKGGRYILQGIIQQSIQLRFVQILFDKELSITGSRTLKPSSWDKAIIWQTIGAGNKCEKNTKYKIN